MKGDKKELDQLHRMTRCQCALIAIDELTSEEKQQEAQQAPMFLTEKRTEEVKGRLLANQERMLADCPKKIQVAQWQHLVRVLCQLHS